MNDRTGWNLPPGCSERDIPGNTLDDEAFERFLDTEEFAAVQDESEATIGVAFKAWRDAMMEPKQWE